MPNIRARSPTPLLRLRESGLRELDAPNEPRRSFSMANPELQPTVGVLFRALRNAEQMTSGVSTLDVLQTPRHESAQGSHRPGTPGGLPTLISVY
jgi:hypothetical protein